MEILLFIIGLIILVKGADLLVNGASALARRFNVPDLVIGLTIVAFGTSAPELFVNVYASITGNTEIAIGNILGSNIANILLILGIAGLITPLAVQKKTVWKEIPFALLAAMLVLLLAGDLLIDADPAGGVISRSDGLVLLSFFLIFLYYAFESMKSETLDETIPATKMPGWKSALFIVAGLTGLTLGGRWIVDGAMHLADLLEIPPSVTSLTIVAIGTSLPELATSVMAAIKKNSDIAIGNVVGSNIFNVFFILGTSATISPLPFTPANLLDSGVTIGVSFLLFIFLFIGKRHLLQRWQAGLFVLLYAAYLFWLIRVLPG